VGADSYRRLVAAHEAGADLAVATYDGTRGNPVLVGRTLWDEARALSGDVGARALMERHDVVEVDCTGTGSPDDVDTIEDLRALEERLAAERD
jgi:CTP:molybdopterin cytidylyltransferase MocA